MSCTAEKTCMNGQYSTTSHATIPKAMSPSTAVFINPKAVRPWEAQDITRIFDQSQADEAQGSEPDSYPPLRLNRRAIKFLYRGRQLGAAEVAVQVLQVGHGFAMVAGAWRQLFELREPLWKKSARQHTVSKQLRLQSGRKQMLFETSA